MRGRPRSDGYNWRMLAYPDFYIEGAWQAPASAVSLDVHSASTEAVIGRISLGNADDVDRAVRAARHAFDAHWSQTTPATRAGWLDRIAAGLKATPGRNRAHDRHGGRLADHPGDRGTGGPARRGDAAVRRARARLRVRPRDWPLARHARAIRRRGRDYAVELSAAPDHGEGRAGARGGMHGGAEAIRDRPAERLPARRCLSRDRIRPASSTSSTARARWPARPWSGTRASTW